jgi:hypothetical protein
VILRAGEVLEEVAVALRRHDAQVEAQALVRDDGRLRRPERGHVGHPPEVREVLGEGGRILRGGDDVEVAEGLAAAAHRPRLRDLLGRGVLP